MNIERKIIHLLKLKGPLSTNHIAETLNISKTCAYSHISSLENKNFLERRLIKTRVGRPAYRFILTDEGINSMNEEGCFLTDLLSFIVKSDKGEIIGEFLKKIYHESLKKYETVLIPGDARTRAEQLVSLRSSEGYMASLINGVENRFFIEQANCPIFKMAKVDGNACELERNMYEELLGETVELSHRQVQGHGVCRFHLKSRKDS